MDACLNVVGVIQKGKKLPVEHDGLVPALKFGHEATIVVRRQPQSAYVRVSAAKDITHVSLGTDRLGAYAAHSLVLPAVYVDNHLRQVTIDENAIVRISEIALIMQGRKVFQTAQTTYTEQVYRGDRFDRVLIPRFCRPYTERPWPQMVDVITELVRREGLARHLPAYVPRPATSPKWLLKPDQAIVEWFNLAKRCGMAMTFTGDSAIILAKDVPQNGTRLRYVEPGQKICFKSMVRQTEGCPFRLEGISLN